MDDSVGPARADLLRCGNTEGQQGSSQNRSRQNCRSHPAEGDIGGDALLWLGGRQVSDARKPGNHRLRRRPGQLRALHCAGTGQRSHHSGSGAPPAAGDGTPGLYRTERRSCPELQYGTVYPAFGRQHAGVAHRLFAGRYPGDQLLVHAPHPDSGRRRRGGNPERPRGSAASHYGQLLLGEGRTGRDGGCRRKHAADLH